MTTWVLHIYVLLTQLYSRLSRVFFVEMCMFVFEDRCRLGDLWMNDELIDIKVPVRVFIIGGI